MSDLVPVHTPFDIMQRAGAPRWSMFFLLQTSAGPVRAWLGIGDFYLPPDDVDLEGGVYQGIGLIGDIPVLSQLIGSVAERVEFVLSGAIGRVLDLADAEAHTVRSAPVTVGIVDFDDDWQPCDPIDWCWDGTADRPSVSVVSGETGETQTVSLSVGTVFTDQTRPTLSYYTDVEQKMRSPDDDFCMHTAAMALDSSIVWPAPD